MSFDPETTRVVRSWLDEGVTQLPDRVLDSVLDQVPATSQRRATWWPARRGRSINTHLAVAVASAAVVIITLIGLGLSSGERVGGPGTDDATPSPSSSARELPTGFVSLDAGWYRLGNGFPADLIFEIPDGWDACVYGQFEQGLCSRFGDAWGVAFLAVDNVVVHPCETRLLDPPAGRSIDAFLSAVADLPGFDVTESVAVTRGDVVGQQVIVTAPADPQCPSLRTWSVPGRTNGVHAGEVNLVEVFDVGGRLIAVTAAYGPGDISPERVDEIRRIMETVELRP